jgi:excisionase family DNA binding protein
VSELALSIPREFVEAIADAVILQLRPQLGVRGDAKDWQLWNIEETAARLGRSQRTVRKWAKDGRLTHVRLDGGALAFDPEDVQNFARARRIGADVVKVELLRQRACSSQRPDSKTRVDAT